MWYWNERPMAKLRMKESTSKWKYVIRSLSFFEVVQPSEEMNTKELFSEKLKLKKKSSIKKKFFFKVVKKKFNAMSLVRHDLLLKRIRLCILTKNDFWKML